MNPECIQTRPTATQRRPIRKPIALLLCGLLVSSLSTAMWSQQTVHVSWRAVDPRQELVVHDGVLQLSLEDAVSIALAQNLGLRIERFTRARSLFQVRRELGIYDLRLSSILRNDDQTSPTTSALVGSQTNSQVLDLTIDQGNVFGGNTSLQWNNSRNENNNSFFTVNPSFRVDLDVVYSQPLLRGFGKQATERNLRIARLDSRESLESFELAVTSTIQQVENAYWTLVEAREQLGVAQESLKLAQDLHEMNRVQVEVGTKAPLDLVSSEAGIATRQEEIIRARAAVDDAADELRRLLNLDGRDLWAAAIETSTDPQTSRISIDFDEAIKLALQNRPELQTQQLEIDKLETDTTFFRSQQLPMVDLELTYGFNGVGGNTRTVAPGFDSNDPTAPRVVIPGGYGDALSQVLDRGFRGWTAMVRLAYPLQNRAAKAQTATARINLEQGKVRLDQTMLQVRTEALTAARAVETAAQQIDSASKSRELQERNLDAEQKRYENGIVTSYQVLQVQEDLSLARSREVQAITGYRRALTQYYRSTGQLLDELGIEIEDVENLDDVLPARQ